MKYLHEYLRPWKLFSYLCGVFLLIVGSFYYQAPDWDIPISIIMSLSTYLTASWSLRVILEHQWTKLPIMLFYTWISVDGLYSVYWHFKNPLALELMREANFFASLSLYGICGLIWYYNGDIKDLYKDIRDFFFRATQ